MICVGGGLRERARQIATNSQWVLLPGDGMEARRGESMESSWGTAAAPPWEEMEPSVKAAEGSGKASTGEKRRGPG